MTTPLTDMSNLLFQELTPALPTPKWGPAGQEVFERTYSRVKNDGQRETWDETVRRVVRGNLSLVSSDRIEPGEEEELFNLIYSFRGIPAGRHLWMSGVPGRQFLFNCYVSGWGDRFSEHFAFTFNQLMEGGGVGANYSAKYLSNYQINTLTRIHIVCSEDHPDFKSLDEAGLISPAFLPDQADYKVEDSREGWASALAWIINVANSIHTQDSLALVVDVSNIRESGAVIKTFGGTSAGPVPFSKMIKNVGHLLNEMHAYGVTGPLCMEIDHAIAECVVSGNVRRSARMSIMRWDDPSIDWFLSCKENGLSHWSTNISVEIDDEFISYVQSEKEMFSFLDHSKWENANKVYQAIIAGMLSNGEPGIWNSTLSNIGEPNPVTSTNPCGEIALEAWENCNLGHVNLDLFVDASGAIDYDGLINAHRLIARFLTRATFGDITDPKTQDVVSRNRRIGVGHFGYSGFVAKQGIRFSESHKYADIAYMLSDMKHVVKSTVERYAHELRIPTPVKATTVAPTGSIAKLPGAGEGIHPVYARYFIRRIRYSTVDPDQAKKLESFVADGYKVVDDPQVPNCKYVEIPMKEPLVDELSRRGIDTEVLESVDEISLKDMLSVQAMYQTYWADNAVSYTVNIDPTVHTEQSIGRILTPFLRVLKGTTIFPERGYEAPPMERITEAQYVALRGSEGVYGTSYDDCASGACPVK